MRWFELTLATPLIAADFDVETVIKIVFFVILIFGSALAKLASAVFENLGKKGPPPRPGAGGANPQADQLRREVGDFLKRFGVEIEEAPAKQKQPPIVTAEVVREPLVKNKGRERPAKPAPTARQGRPPKSESAPSGRQKSGQQSSRPGGQGVSQHVKEHLDTGKMRQHAQSLGSRISDADERVESRLRERFSHNVSHLAEDHLGEQPIGEGTDSATWSDRIGGYNPAVERIRQMLATPQSARDALILSEILRPMHDRESLPSSTGEFS